ncbi:hypothetical protein HN020_09230 [Brevibacillus borstelensis]|jgi:hypothetical protein|uniref:hypothetical protein n=1 Tax=Brevibacillus borstelensis TaxID=45462 RepID=UPI0004694A7A|nr:hypothetical protein [Brevibacillus borstelensis]NOU54930.1 hypothetical protein [Brevibacillus borstelensis]
MLGGVSNQGVFARTRTFKTSLTKADVGKAVAMVGNNEVGLGADGDMFAGKLVRLEKDGICTVETHGNVKVPYSGTLAVGKPVVVDGTGKVKDAGTGTNGRGFTSVVDATASTVEIEL